jgi:Domain of unknown function (DUF6851)/VCPO second helical-bundle domain
MTEVVGKPLSRRQLLRCAGVGGFALFLPGMARAQPLARWAVKPAENVVVQWNNAVLQGVRDSRLGPPMVSRALAIAHTSIFDAWAAYDGVAVGTRLGGALRRPARERTLANKSTAVSFAAYRAAVDLFPGDKASVFDPLMASLGYDPGDLSTDVSTPAGIGNVASRALLDYRHRDGANQLGDEPGGISGVPYSDYTGYTPLNAPMDIRVPFDPTSVHDPDHWQPLRYVDGSGTLVTPGFVGAQWQHVIPFAMASSSDLRSPTGPAAFGTVAYRTQCQQLIDLSAALTDEQKMIAEYWADGPHSELPPGHWNLFAQQVYHRDRTGDSEHDLDQAVKLFFALTNAVFDAGICAWDNKRVYDSVRPITAIRVAFQGQPIRAWAGPGKGTQTIPGEQWFPYQPTTFPTPPFPEYSSGHSNFSAAGSEILKQFTGSNRFGGSVSFPAGSSRIEPGLTPAADLTLSWATFSDAADQAGSSRRYGGIHFEQGDLDGRETGREVAQKCWQKAQAYING